MGGQRHCLHVIIVVEVFKREVTSAILLKLELEKRGYKVSIKRKSEDICFKYTDLLIVPNGYGSSGYNDYRYRFNCKSGKIINLQWEQLFTRYEEENNKWLAEGRAKELVFLCWGQNRVDKLNDVGVAESNIFKVGPIHTDAMRKELSYIWKSRDEVADRYKLDKEKEWVLFISSLTFATSNSAFINSTKKIINYVNYDQRHVVEENTQKEIIDWLDSELEARSDIIVIYRPHPTEKASPNLLEAENRNPNRFNVISDLDLKQWITVSDTLVLWNSTSAIECFMSKKKCVVVRPYDIEYKDEYILYDGCDFSRNYQEFRKKIQSKTYTFPIKEKMLKYYYDIEGTPSFLRICDAIDTVAQEDSYYNYEPRYIRNRIKYLMRNNILVKLMIKNIYCLLHKHFGLSIKSLKFRDKFFVDSWEKSIKERIEAVNIENRIKQRWDSLNF